MLLFSINRSRGYQNPSLDIIVIELCSTGGCPLKEAHEHCFQIQSLFMLLFLCHFNVIVVNVLVILLLFCHYQHFISVLHTFYIWYITPSQYQQVSTTSSTKCNFLPFFLACWLGEVPSTSLPFPQSCSVDLVSLLLDSSGTKGDIFQLIRRPFLPPFPFLWNFSSNNPLLVYKLNEELGAKLLLFLVVSWLLSFLPYWIEGFRDFAEISDEFARGISSLLPRF